MDPKKKKEEQQKRLMRGMFPNDATYQKAVSKLAESNSSNNYYMNLIADNENVDYSMDDDNYSARLIERLNLGEGEDSDKPNNNRITLEEIYDDANPDKFMVSNKGIITSGKGVHGSDINLYANLYHSNNLRMSRSEIYTEDRMFNQTFRFGMYNPFGQISTAREFVFFTKPDLHIFKTDDKTMQVYRDQLNDGLGSYFWSELTTTKKRIVESLQASYTANDVKARDPFNHLLQNTLVSNLEVPSLNAPSIETSTNTYGVSLTYRGSSEDSDDGPEFSLEFKDDRYLNVYTFFRAYEEYETLKKHGIIKPQLQYIYNKILHDQFCIYKFIVDEDMETIIYWGKYYGVYPTSLPRDAFNNDNFQDGLSFSINFKAAFYEDMRPEILFDFNKVSKEMFDSCTHRIDIYNDSLMRFDGRAAKSAMVYIVQGDRRANQNPNQYYYKLVWKGDDTV